MDRGWTWSTRVGASGNGLEGAAGDEGEGGSFAPKDAEDLTSVSAIFCLSYGRRDVVRARSVLMRRALPAWCLLPRVLLSLFLVSGVPAILDLRQELPHRFDVFLTPGMHLQVAQVDGLGCGHFLPGNVATESPGIDAEPLGSFSR